MSRWLILIASIVSFTTSLAHANTFYYGDIPDVNNDPVVNRKFDADMFEFVAKTLSGKMAPHMKCSLKVRNSREVRNFSDGKQWVEILDVDFNTNGFDSGYKMSFKIPMTAKYGIKKTTNQWSGVGEEVKIELGDYYGHWLKFSHDGRGRLIQFIMGNNLRSAPCEVR